MVVGVSHVPFMGSFFVLADDLIPKCPSCGQVSLSREACLSWHMPCGSRLTCVQFIPTETATLPETPDQERSEDGVEEAAHQNHEMTEAVYCLEIQRTEGSTLRRASKKGEPSRTRGLNRKVENERERGSCEPKPLLEPRVLSKQVSHGGSNWGV